MKTKRLIPYMATPPIEIVKDEMDARGISLEEMAALLEMSVANLNRMFEEGADITPMLAKKLEQAWGIGAGTWLKLQQIYEQDKAEIEQRDKNRAKQQ